MSTAEAKITRLEQMTSEQIVVVLALGPDGVHGYWVCLIIDGIIYLTSIYLVIFCQAKKLTLD